MRKYEIVRSHDDFDNIIKNGKCVKNKYYIIYNEDNSLNYARFGIAVGKKIGNAVTRNKIKRQIRSIVSNNKKLFPISKDYIIIIKKSILEVDYKTMENEIKNLL